MDRYPTPRDNDFNYIIKGKIFFPKLIFFKVYIQILIAEGNKQKTELSISFSLFEFNVVSFGLRLDTCTFQKLICTTVFQDLEFFSIFLDNALTAFEENYKHLNLVFERLKKIELQIDISKLLLGVNKLKFLGYLFTYEGLCPFKIILKLF